MLEPSLRAKNGLMHCNIEGAKLQCNWVPLMRT
jgi:hypothetical protein